MIKRPIRRKVKVADWKGKANRERKARKILIIKRPNFIFSLDL